MKRTFAFMMALVLVFSLAATAFAAGGAGEGSITITNATVGKTYYVHKIFDATYQGTNVTYTIKPSDEFFDDLFGVDGTTPNDYFEYHAATGVVTRKAGKTDAQLFAYLNTLVEGKGYVQSQNASGTTVDFTGLDTGYYVISRSDGSSNGVTITTTKPHADVHDKNSLPGGDLEKKSDKPTADVGDVINWEVTFTATRYDDGEKVLSYTITDTLTPTDWAAIDTGSIKVFVAGAEIPAWNLVSGSTNGFEILIPWVDSDGNFKYADSAEVKITYSATVLEAGAANKPADQVNKNTVELDWSCNTDTDKPKDETETEVYNLGFTKVDGTNSKPLAGAVFALYSDSACTMPVYVKANGADGVYIVDKDRDSTDSNSVVTPASGQVVIMGLDAGTYYLKETTAPAGYNLLTDPQPVTVEAGAGAVMNVGGTEYYVNNAALNIQNFSGVELPSTGGKGTIMMISFGTMVALAFAVLMITQKKMSIYQD